MSAAQLEKQMHLTVPPQKTRGIGRICVVLSPFYISPMSAFDTLKVAASCQVVASYDAIFRYGAKIFHLQSSFLRARWPQVTRNCPVSPLRAPFTGFSMPFFALRCPALCPRSSLQNPLRIIISKQKQPWRANQWK